jgi:hypothetical protein
MARAPAKFREADVKRAVKGALAAGLKIAEVKIEEGGVIRIVSAGDEITIAEDRDLAKFRRQHGYS